MVHNKYCYRGTGEKLTINNGGYFSEVRFNSLLELRLRKAALYSNKNSVSTL
jgi:hypothetical protein